MKNNLTPWRASFQRLLPLLLGLSCATGAALCQSLPFHRYTTQDGLPSNHITSLCQDSRGYLWIGTDNGLSMYDGIEFKNFTTADGLPNLYITDIIERPNEPGTFWIGTIAGGLARMSGGHVTTIHLGDNNVSNLYEDPEGTLWCSSGDGNYRVTHDSVSFVSATGPSGSDIQGFEGDRVLILTANTATLHHHDGSVEWKRELGLRQNEFVFASTRDASGVLWIFTSEGRVLTMEGSVIRYHRLQETLRPSLDIPSRVIDDGRGSLWITTPREIAIIDKRALTIRTLRDLDNPFKRLSGPILADREGTMWFGTYGQGLMKLSEERIYRMPVGPVNEGAYNMVACSDSNGHIWISTPSTLIEAAQSTGRKWNVFKHPWPHWHARGTNSALFIDPRNRLWIGPTMSAQPFRCYAIGKRTEAESRLNLVDSLLPQPIREHAAGLTFAVDRFQRGWFSTGSPGIAVQNLEGRTLVQVLTSADGLPTDPGRALLVDRNGSAWYGTWAAGLTIIEQRADSFYVRQGPHEVEGAGVRSLYEDHEGQVWIGTRYAGLVYSGHGEHKTVSVRDGLLSNAIWSIAGTDHCIWCGTDVGLEGVDKQTCKPLPHKSELIGNRVYACGAFKNEYVWCISSNELLVYEEPERTTRAVPPPIHVRSFTVNGIAMSPDSHHEFVYTQNSCAIDFAGISFRDERNVRYRYRMLGHDSTWTKPVKDHRVTYASLQPGRYEFQVLAINGDGVSSTAPASVSFVIAPPFWMRWWFIAAMTLLAFSVLYGLFRYRLYHLMNMERMRLRIAGDLHDDVGTNLSSIVISSQILERDGALTDELRYQLREIRLVAATTQEMMRDIVWMLNPSNDSLDDFILKMKEAAARLLSDIPFTFTAPPKRMLDKVSIEFKRNVFLIFKEVLNNVSRHSGATRTTIEVTHDDEVLTLKVSDNGRGFDVTQASSGSGIASLKRRAEHIGGTIEFGRPPEGGTSVTLSVKYHANA